MPIIKNEIGAEVRQRLIDIKDIRTLSEEAIKTSEDAKSVGEQASKDVDSMQNQIDEIAVGATNAETAQIRVDADGKTYTTAKERVDELQVYQQQALNNELGVQYKDLQDRLNRSDTYLNSKKLNASGSNLTTAVSGASGSAVVTLENEIDFEDGQGVAIYAAGELSSLSKPIISSVTPSSTGTRSYAYRICAIDEDFGVSAASNPYSITNGPATLSATNSNRIQWSEVAGAVAYLIYGRDEFGQVLLGVTQQLSYTDAGSYLTDIPNVLPTAAVNSNTNKIYRSKVVGGGGTKQLELSTPLGKSISSVTIFHDDTEALQEMLDLAVTSNTSALLDGGVHNITKDLSMPGKLRLLGYGEESVIKTNAPFINGIVSTNTEEPVIENIKLVGSKYGTQPLNASGSPDVRFSGSGIVFAGVERGKVASVIIEDFGGDGRESARNGVAAIWLTFGCRQCHANFNIVDNCRNGINEDNYFSKDPYYNTVMGNTVQNCRFGIVTDNGSDGKGYKFLYNTILNCIYSAIDVNKSSRGIIEGNYCEGNGNVGDGTTFAATINVYGSSTFRVRDVKVVGNIVIDNYGHGIKVAQNTSTCHILDNMVGNSKNGVGILIQASRYYRCSGNIVFDNASDGIHAMPITVGSTEVQVDNSILAENVVLGNGRHGIILEKALFVIVTANRVANNGAEAAGTYSGLSLTLASLNNTVTGNIVTGTNHKYGIATLDDSTKTNIFNDNVSLGNAQNYGFASQDQIYGVNIGLDTRSGGAFRGAMDLKTYSAPLYLSGAAGKPTGTVANEIKLDTTNEILWVNVQGAWKGVKLQINPV